MGNARAQDGKTIGTAIPLGPLTNTVMEAGAISTTNLNIYYKFSITESVTAVTVTIPGLPVPNGGQLTLSIVNGNSGPGFLSSLKSVPAGNSLTQMTLWLDPGIYYVQLTRANEDTTFELFVSGTPQPTAQGIKDSTIQAASTLPPINFGVIKDDFVGGLDTVHYYQFSVTGSVMAVTASIPALNVPNGGALNFSILNGTPGANLGTSLGYFNAYNVATVYTLWLDPGTYYVKVTELNEDTEYKLNLTSAPVTTRGTNDSTLAGASLLPPISFETPIFDDVSLLHQRHWYKFDVTGSVTAVTATFPTGFVPYGDSLPFSFYDGNAGANLGAGLGNYTAGYTTTSATVWLDPGTYYVVVGLGNAATNYQFILSQTPEPDSLGLNDNTLRTAKDKGEIINDVVVDDFVGFLDTVDWFHFHVTGPARTLTAAISGASLAGSVNLEIWQDPTDNGIGNYLAAGTAGPNSKIISATVGPGDYYVQVTANNNNTPYELTVSRQFTSNTAPFIITQPNGVTITLGQAAGFSVLADASAAFSYQWLLNGTNVFGATNSSVSLQNLVSGVGSYNVSVLLSNALGSVTSSNAVLVVEPPALVRQPTIDRAVIVSWSVTNSTSYVLESAPSTSGPWTPVNRPVTQLLDTHEVSVRVSNPIAMFRLHQEN